MNSFIHKIEVDLGMPRASMDMFDRMPDLATADCEVVNNSTFTQSNEYKMTLTIQMMATCKPNRKDNMLDNFVEEIRRMLYKDGIDDLMRLERAVYEAKEEDCMSALRDLKTLMTGR